MPKVYGESRLEGLPVESQIVIREILEEVNTTAGYLFVGAGSPETKITGNVGSLYLRTDGAAGTSLYVKQTSSGANTGWAAFAAPAAAGHRNRLSNANPLINQRGYVSGAATTGANQYTLDRWRVVVSGQSVSWTDSSGIRTLTCPAGGLEQVIEAANITAGTYAVSWAGTATCLVDGASVANGATFTASGTANVVVRFSGGTLATPQVEPNTVTPFEHRPLAAEAALCDRYCQRYESPSLRGVVLGVSSLARMGMPLRTKMRAAPTASLIGTLSVYDGAGIGTVTAIGVQYSSVDTIEFDFTTATGVFTPGRPAIAYVNTAVSILLTSEL